MKKRVLLGMSGGVDSSVAAIVLKKQGFEVIGITMNLWETEGGSNLYIAQDAKKICDYLQIPHYTFDFIKEFENHVIKDFCNCYAKCKTPNPCIECNRYLKFGAMWQKAQELKCDYISTGHYAKTEFDKNYGQVVLKKSNSLHKDQSYVLWNIPKELIEKILLPLGEYKEKAEIRTIAAKYNLPVATKPDSQDICFIPNGNYKDFLEKYANFKKLEGNIVTTEGEILGKHKGLYNYTIGQRKGLGISHKTPLFVIGFRPEKNELIVGEEEKLYCREIEATEVNWLLDKTYTKPKQIMAKTRYTAKEAKATIFPTENGTIKVVFEEPQRAVTPGQSIVFYNENVVLGGGKI